MMLIAVVVIALAVTAGCGKVSFDENAWRQQILSADRTLLYAEHLGEDGLFFNPWLPQGKRGGTLKNGLRLRFSPPDNLTEFSEDSYRAVENAYEYLSDDTKSRISFAGHASFIIQMDSKVIFTDPFFSKKAFIVNKDVVIDFDFSKVPDKPVALISHNHYDHLDEYSVKKLADKDALFIVPLKLKEFLVKLGAKNVYELDWWEELEIEGIKYTFLPSQHWSRRLWQTGGSTLWGGFMIEGSYSVYFSGDSGYFVGFKEFGEKFSIDYAIVGVGAYMPRWFMHYSHLNVNEFFDAADDLQAKITIPMHLGVIKLGKEPILYPLYEIGKYIDENPKYNNKVRPLRAGEYLDMGEDVNE